MPSGSKVPHWNLNSIYPSFDAPEYKGDLTRLGVSTDTLLALLGKPLDNEPEALLRLITAYEQAHDIADNLLAYAEAVYTTDTRAPCALAEVNAIEAACLPLRKAAVVFRQRLSEAADSMSRLLNDPQLAPYAFFVNKEITAARFQLSPEMEELANDLSRSGGDAWTRLHEAISSTASALWNEQSGERKTVIQLRSLATDPDRSVREKAFLKEIEVWKSVEIPLAAALNGVKGVSITLDTRRGWNSPLQKSAFQSRVSEKTLNALIAALETSLPLFRHYLKDKARALGVEQCAFYDLFAPLGAESRKWTWEETADYIPKRFDAFDPDMGAFARCAFESAWIDAEPRAGKVGGAYCTGFPLAGESRILCNFDGSFDAICTVAHELGHAWHHELIKDLPSSLVHYPMTLAETASIFAETLLFESALNDAQPSARAALIESNLKDACQVIVDILSRFYFECALFEERRRAEVSSARLCELMLDAQTRTYGDGLAIQHPYMWAVKGHYYSPSLAFYNYPYAFGLLFSLSLYAKAQDSGGATFAPSYRALLKATGSASAEEVARSAGFDIEQQAFWDKGVALIANRVEAFSAEVQKQLKALAECRQQPSQ
ncbi:MAG: M3 family oligoendopeptidase [Treponema sp.]|jgi:pepF/M3 family oligoendopeptidase|nr:M3 family oligoendopeptidase [Treponema sp.]